MVSGVKPEPESGLNCADVNRMMTGLRPPGNLCLEGNVSDTYRILSRNWKEWIRAVEFYETAT